MIFMLCAVFITASLGLSAQSSTLNIPVNGATCVNKPVLLGWSVPSGTIQGTVSYKLQISTTSTFSGTYIVLDQTQPSTSFSNTFYNDATTYYWRVGTIFSSDPSTTYFTSPNNFTINSSAPVAMSPVSNSCTSLSSTFTWGATPSATLYNLQYSEFFDFSSSVTTATFSNTFGAVTVPKNFTTYYWRVSANVGACTSPYSNSASFTTVVGAPKLTIPANNMGGQAATTDLVWDVVPGATGYDIQLSTTSSFTTSTTYTTNSNTMIGVSTPGANTAYYWRVKSFNGSSCPSDWSSINTFKTLYASPTLTTPTSGQSCVPLAPVYTWVGVQGATSYELQTARDQSFLPQVTEYSNTFSSTTATNILANSSSTYFWRVRAKDDNNVGSWSSVRYFVSTIASPAPVSPSNGTLSLPMTVNFNWQNQSQVTNFVFQISKDSTFATLLKSDTLTNTSRTVTLVDYNTKHFWRVKTVLTPCESAWSQVRSFTTQLGYPLLLEPADKATKLPLKVTFKWTPVPQGKSYDMEVSKSGTTFTPIFQLSNSSIQGTDITVSGFASSSTYFWRMRTRDESGVSPWSPVRWFVTGISGPAVPFLMSPDHGAKKFAVDGKLVWHKAANATKYRLQLATDPNFTILVNDTNNIVDTTFTTNNLQYFKNHWWKVAAVNDSGQTLYSEARQFRTIAFPPTDTTNLFRPAADTTNQPLINLYFNWSKLPRTEEYNTLTDLYGGYEIQIATDVNFSSTFLVNRNIYFNETLVNDFNDNTNYFWRVRGWNEADNGPWSKVRKFITGAKVSVNYEEYNFNASLNPTPATDYSNLSFTLPNDGSVKVTILDNNGRLVKEVMSANMPAGKNIVNMNTLGLSSGVYFFNIEFDNKFQAGRFIISR